MKKFMLKEMPQIIHWLVKFANWHMSEKDSSLNVKLGQIVKKQITVLYFFTINGRLLSLIRIPMMISKLTQYYHPKL